MRSTKRRKAGSKCCVSRPANSGGPTCSCARFKTGALDLALINTDIAGSLSPSFTVFSTPYLFPSLAAADAVVDGAVLNRLPEGIRASSGSSGSPCARTACATFSRTSRSFGRRHEGFQDPHPRLGVDQPPLRGAGSDSSRGRAGGDRRCAQDGNGRRSRQRVVGVVGVQVSTRRPRSTSNSTRSPLRSSSC